ncbi:ABC transporter permease subunit [Cupriavidus basilensis]
MFLWLSVYTAAFIVEIVRGAILALPKGQWEAAAALGLSRRYAFRDVVIPQVFRVVLPAFGNSSFLVVSASFALSPPDELSGWVGWVTGT